MAIPTAQDPYGVRDEPNTIRQRIDDYARELIALIDSPDHCITNADSFPGEVWHLCFANTETDVDGKVWPRNDAEWLELRDETFEAYFRDHAAERLTTDMYPSPVNGVIVAVSAALGDIVADRALELSGRDTDQFTDAELAGRT